MTYRVVTGSSAVPFTSQPKAVSAYTAAVRAYPREHVLLIEGEELPGIPPKVIAEHFDTTPAPSDGPVHIVP